jgi:hypothetical protein
LSSHQPSLKLTMYTAHKEVACSGLWTCSGLGVRLIIS